MNFDPRDLDDTQLQRALAQNKIDRGRIKNEENDLKREFLRRHGNQAGTISVRGGVEVELQTNHRFNPDLAQEYLDEAELEAISENRINTERAREILDPDRYALCVKKSDMPKFQVRMGKR